MSKRNLTRARIITATIQAKVWRNQMKGKHKDTLMEKLLKKLKDKYPEIDVSDRRFISSKVIQ